MSKDVSHVRELLNQGCFDLGRFVSEIQFTTKIYFAFLHAHFR